jgi:hypothetical protein
MGEGGTKCRVRVNSSFNIPEKPFCVYVRVMNDSYKQILDRQYADEMSPHFKDAIKLLNELLDYGTFLLPRSYGSSPRDIKAICLIFVQFRQFLAHLDGVAGLASVGNCFSAILQLRSLLEINLAMEWILKADTEEKAKHLWVANIRRRKQWQSIPISGTPEAARRPDAANRISLTAEQMNQIRDEVRKLEAILIQPEFSEINLKFEADYSARGFDRPWYEVYGDSRPKTTIRKIAEDVGRLPEYQDFYSSFSSTSHGGDMWKNVVFGGETIWVNPIREPQDIPRTTKYAVTLAFRVYKMLLDEYRPGEVENFCRKYVNEWRGRFQQQYSVTVTPQDTLI